MPLRTTLPPSTADCWPFPDEIGDAGKAVRIRRASAVEPRIGWCRLRSLRGREERWTTGKNWPRSMPSSSRHSDRARGSSSSRSSPLRSAISTARPARCGRTSDMSRISGVTPLGGLSIDQVVVHVDGNTAVVSARSSRKAGSYSRYVDGYERRNGGWVCIHACVWPLPTSANE